MIYYFKYIGYNKVVSSIGKNTYCIMMHHVFAFFVFNTCIYLCYKLFGIFSNFNVNQYSTTIWYTYNKNNGALLLIYVIIGICLPLLVKYFFEEKLKWNYLLKQKIEKIIVKLNRNNQKIIE